jgi:hypothetical protein
MNSMSTFRFILQSSLLALFLISCDNPVEDDHDHADIQGLVLMMEGQELVVVEDATVTGSITVAEGQETPGITVEWRDGDGEHFHDEDLDPDLTLEHASINEAIAEFGQHEGDDRWTFHIHGESAGSTSIELQLFNVDHVDFRTPPIPIVVEAAP